jgi:AraC-like DNA-binding protein
MGAYADPFVGGGVTFPQALAKPEHEPVTLLSVGYLPGRSHWNHPSTFSPFWRLIYDFQPGHMVVFPDREIPLGPERIILIPDHQMFHCVGQEPRPKLWLHFSCARRVAPDQPLPIVLPVRQSIELAVIEELRKLIAAKGHDSNKDRILHVSMAMLHLTLSRPGIRWLDHKPDKLQQSLAYIEENYANSLAIVDLSEMVHMSERAFMRMFQQYQGISPGQHLRQVRVRAASELLLRTQHTLDVIAQAVGLGTQPYLTRVFTQTTGVSPARFRRTHGPIETPDG